MSWIRNTGLFSCSQMTGAAKMLFVALLAEAWFDVMAMCEGGESGGELCSHNGGRPPTRHGRQGPQSHRQDRGLSRQSGEGLTPFFLPCQGSGFRSNSM